MWRKYCVINFSFCWFMIFPIPLWEYKNGRFWTLHDRLCSIFSFDSLWTTIWFLTSCFSVYKINSLMRVLFADCGLTRLWSVGEYWTSVSLAWSCRLNFPWCVHFSLILIFFKLRLYGVASTRSFCSSVSSISFV